MKGFLLISFLLLPFHSAHAQKCSPLESELRGQFNGLLDRIQNQQAPEIRSVDDFLARLPESLRRDYIFMAKSRSLQEGTVASPRVILKSPNSEVVLSFSTDPALRGGNAVEIMVWNAEEATYRMTEIAFNETAGTQRVQHNPAKCLECHQKPPRPVWDPYRFWSGQVPFHEDTVPTGSVEAGWYRDYLANITGGRPRWRHLIPTETPQDFSDSVQLTNRTLTARQPAQNVFSSSDGNGSNLSNQYLRQNACRVINEVAERPDFPQVRYALAGALKGCSNVDDFLPEAYRQSARDYFLRHNQGVSAAGQFSYAELSRDTNYRLLNSTYDKLSAQRWFFKTQGLSEADIDREMALRQNIGFGFTNFEDSATSFTALRYLMLPLGVDVNRWSMAIDPMSFGHGAIFGEYLNQAPIREDVARSCEELAQLSRDALDAVTPPSLSAQDYVCKFNRLDTISLEANQLAELNEGMLSVRAGEHLAACAACHNNGQGGTPFNNVPMIPFNDVNALRTFMQERPGLDKRILDRITRQPGEPGMMPKNMERLSDDAVIDVRNWFQAIRQAP